EPGVGNFAVVERRPLETRRLDSFDLPAPHYMKLDVQGAELEVLEGAGAALDALCVVECEVGFLPLYRGQPLFGDIQRWFAERGFVLHKMIELGSRAYRPVSLGGDPTRGASQWLWADAVFVRDPRPVVDWPEGGRLKAAMVLHALYRSYDLALALLRIADPDRAALYAAALAGAGRVEPWLTNIRHG
ncbi:MAG: FkbM family methyltransferase, partial [Pseudomonadota bacterium]